MAAQSRVRPFEVVEVLPLLELDVEEGGVVDDDAVEESVELFVVNAVGALDLAIESWRCRLDVHVLDAAVEDVPVEGSLELCPVVRLDRHHSKGQALQRVVDELDGGLLVEPVVDLEDPEPGAVINRGVLVMPLASTGDCEMNLTSTWTRSPGSGFS